MVRCSEVEGDCRDGILWLKFPESASVASRCVPEVMSTPKSESLGHANRPLSHKGWGCVSVLSVQYTGFIAYQELSLNVTVSWDPGRQALLALRAR